MKGPRLWLAVLFVVAVAALALWVWWGQMQQFSPHTLKKNQSQIAALLDGSGWVSSHGSGQRIYEVGYRACDTCIAFDREALPALRAAGVDARIIMIARADKNGLAQSTPVERTTVAELAVNRDFGLYQRWMAAPPASWTAPGLAPADGDTARTAVIEAGRKLSDNLRPLLKANGVPAGLPLFVWWNRKGEMRGCVCGQKSLAGIEKELGA